VKLLNDIILLFVRWYTEIYVRLVREKELEPRGLGLLQRLLSEDRIVNVAGCSFYVSAEVADSYGMLTGGYFSEPETHVFLDYLLQQIDDVTFVNGGCNIGEFVITAGLADGSKRVVGYDIHPDCIEACRRSILLNGLEDSCTVYFRGLGSKVDTARVSFGQHAPQGTNLFDEDGQEAKTVEISTLDCELEKGILADEGPYVVLLDVEGYECQVLKGGSTFIKVHHPIIIFEYNSVSRKHFTLNDIRKAIGDEYTVYRLTPDGFLDTKLDDTWNCVGVPCNVCEDVQYVVEERVVSRTNSFT